MRFITSLKTTIALTCFMFQVMNTMEQRPTESKQQHATFEQELGLAEPATLKFRTAYNLLKQGIDVVKSDLPSELKEYVQALQKALYKPYQSFYQAPSSKLIFFNLLNNPNQALNVDNLFPDKSVSEKQAILDTALCNAYGGYFVASLVKAGANPNGKCNLWTMLSAAAVLNDVPKALALLNNNSNINLQTASGDTPLIWAADEPSKLKLLKLLLAHAPDVNIQSKNGTTALIAATMHGNLEAVRHLLKAGADKTKKHNDKTALEWAILRGFIPIINLLSQENIHEEYPPTEKLGVIEPSLTFRSAYSLIKQNTDTDNSNLPTELKTQINLIKKALDPKFFTSITRKLLLNFLNNAHFDAQKLIDEKLSKSQQEIFNEALNEALLSQERTFIDILLDAGADVNAQLPKNKEKGEWTTPLIRAINNNDTVVVDRLIRMGAMVDQGDSFGNTTLMQASANPEATAILKLLLQHSPRIDAQNRYGSTALIDAANSGNTEGVQLLLENGANKNIRAYGARALDFAQDKGHSDIVNILRQN